jgi:hypothetical protein
LQTQESRVPKSDEKKLNKFWNYCIPKGKTKGLIIGMAYVGHFFCVNDNAKVIFDAPQIMHYMLCYSKLIFLFN